MTPAKDPKQHFLREREREREKDRKREREREKDKEKETDTEKEKEEEEEKWREREGEKDWSQESGVSSQQSAVRRGSREAEASMEAIFAAIYSFW